MPHVVVFFCVVPSRVMFGRRAPVYLFDVHLLQSRIGVLLDITPECSERSAMGLHCVAGPCGYESLVSATN